MRSFIRLMFLVSPLFFSYLANSTNFGYSLDLNQSRKETEHVNKLNYKKERDVSIQNMQEKVSKTLANITKLKTKKKDRIVEQSDEVDIFDINTEIATTEVATAMVKKREPVKLNMKQGLTMNQVLGVYSLTDASNELCRNHSQEFSNSLRALEPWALKMFDSSSKLQSGILFGNLYEFGAYKQCLEIHESTVYGSIKGKHCTLRIIPEVWLIQKVLSYRNVSQKRWETVKDFVQNATLDWSVCVPDSCGVEDILYHFTKQISSLTEGLNIKVVLEEENCYTESSQYKLTKVQMVVMCILLIYALFIAAVTFADFNAAKNKANETAWIKIFSAKSNSRQIFAKSKGSSDLDCVHGIRVMSTCYVIVGHRFVIMMFYPIINSLYIIDWILYYRSTAITGGTLCVDTFFMISGMLVSLGYFKLVSNGKINWFLFYIYRYIRITVPLAIAVMFNALFTEYLGSGPLWNTMVEVIEKPCREYWWAVLLHIQNYVHSFPLCMTQTWYLTCDMQYYFLSPIILLPLGRHEALGFANYGLIYVLSVTVSFYLAWANQYNGGVPVTNRLFSTKFFRRYYIAPHARISTYLIGLGFGYYVHKTSNYRVKISNILAVIGWMLCAATMLASLVGCHVFFEEEHDFNRIESSIFLSMSRSAWTLGIVWMVWACINGYGGRVYTNSLETPRYTRSSKYTMLLTQKIPAEQQAPDFARYPDSLIQNITGPINFVLSLHIFKVLGRVSYGMYLLHMGMQFAMGGALQVPLYFSDWNGVFYAVADLFIMTAVGYVFTLMFESPVVQILSLIFKSDSNRHKIQPSPKDDVKTHGYSKY